MKANRESYAEVFLKIIFEPDKSENKCEGCFFNNPEAEGEGGNCTDNITRELNLTSCQHGGHYRAVYIDEVDKGD